MMDLVEAKANTKKNFENMDLMDAVKVATESIATPEGVAAEAHTYCGDAPTVYEMSEEEYAKGQEKIEAAYAKSQLEQVSMLVAKYLQDDSALSELELSLLKESGVLDKISKIAPPAAPTSVKIEEEETKELKLAELTVQDMYCEVGRLEEEKMMYLTRIQTLNRNKQDFLFKLGMKYGMAGKNFYVDLNTSEIKLRTEQV